MSGAGSPSQAAPSNRFPLLFVVEGQNDIEFLRRDLGLTRQLRAFASATRHRLHVSCPNQSHEPLEMI